jgi:hypothetical protein
MGIEERPYSSKIYFRPGGTALSEWTCTGRAEKDTAVADYAIPSVITT